MGYLLVGLVGALIGLFASALDHITGGAKDCPQTTMDCPWTYASILVFAIFTTIGYALVVS